MLQLRPMPALALVCVLALALAGCDDETGPTGPGTVVIQFDNVVDGAPLQMNQQIYTNAAGNSYSVTKLEYVASRFNLHAPSSPVASFRAEDFSVAAPHYRTEANAATRTLTFADVPAGTYDALEFTFGLIGSDNVSGAFPDLDAASMQWPTQMGGGYHYMRFEGNFSDTLGGTAGFTTHTGPSMGNDYSFGVSLGASIVVSSGETTTIVLNMNVNNWYTNPTTYDLNDYGAIMGNPGAQGILKSNGADVFSIAGVINP